ncbi:hypothetical protein CDO51_10855 [Natranaerobius trueperi]|uniref:Uncharacterized protein n=2 Tax=Natranaerobius trueperi TaxID=759412 RepID=A0A226BW39_9FIRM|nr:hypothetical protein CDO51_10855 [Natranaerobius trueperi]
MGLGIFLGEQFVYITPIKLYEYIGALVLFFLGLFFIFNEDKNTQNHTKELTISTGILLGVTLAIDSFFVRYFCRYDANASNYN